MLGEGDFGAGQRPTPEADPRHVYHNFSIAIDPARKLFNGAEEEPIPAPHKVAPRSARRFAFMLAARRDLVLQ